MSWVRSCTAIELTTDFKATRDANIIGRMGAAWMQIGGGKSKTYFIRLWSMIPHGGMPS
jgi:hypothetical protein